MSKTFGSVKDLKPVFDRDGLALEIVDESSSSVELKKKFNDFYNQHPNWLIRKSLEGHLTASGIVIDPESEKVLLIKHKKLGLWLQPGGHADGDSNLAHVAWKEVSEETGLREASVLLPAFDLDIHEIPLHKDVPEHLHLDVRFLMIASVTDQLDHNHEVDGIDWVPFDDPRLLEGSLLPSMQRAKNTISNL